MNTIATLENNISFAKEGEIIMTLDSEGMTYLGERINDAGEAHRAFLEAMSKMNDAAEHFPTKTKPNTQTK